MALSSGTKLGPHEILSHLGAGGMGEVYRARDTRLDRNVAVKILPTHLSSNPEAKQRFEFEARAISSLNHPHICTLYDVGHQDGTDYVPALRPSALCSRRLIFCNAVRLKARGAPVKVLDGGMLSENAGNVALVVSSNGALAYAPGGPIQSDISEVLAVSHSGAPRVLSPSPRIFDEPVVSPDWAKSRHQRSRRER